MLSFFWQGNKEGAREGGGLGERKREVEPWLVASCTLLAKLSTAISRGAGGRGRVLMLQGRLAGG